MIISVGRSPFRILAVALLAAPMILLSVDITLTQRFFPAPDSTRVVVGQTVDETGRTIDVTEDQLTNDGKAQRRRDLMWGGVLFAGGVAAAFYGLRELFLPRRVITADQRGLNVRIYGSRKPPVRLAWNEVAAVRSGVIEDEGGQIEVLSIRPSDPTLLPESPVGAIVQPPWLHVLADDWERPPHLIAPVIEGWITGYGRAEQYE